MSYPYKGVKARRPNDRRRKRSFRRTLMNQILWAIIIVAMIILIKSMNLSLTNKAVGTIKETINNDMDMKKVALYFDRARVKATEVQEKTISVFSFMSNKRSNIKYVPPIEGEITSYYGQSTEPYSNTKNFQRGIDMQSYKDTFIRSIDEGVVAEVGESDTLGKYIKISHDSDVFAIYSNCSEIKVKEKQNVTKGESIAVFRKDDENYFHFELWVNGDVVDPSDYIEFKNII